MEGAMQEREHYIMAVTAPSCNREPFDGAERQCRVGARRARSYYIHLYRWVRTVERKTVKGTPQYGGEPAPARYGLPFRQRLNTRMVHRLAVRVAALLAVGLVSCAGPRSGTVDGDARMYLVQLDMTDEKETAEKRLSTALQWWNSSTAHGLPEPVSEGGESPFSIEWRAPLYRIRLGPYPRRQQAERVVSAAQESFPEAFVVPDRPQPAPSDSTGS